MVRAGVPALVSTAKTAWRMAVTTLGIGSGAPCYVPARFASHTCTPDVHRNHVRRIVFIAIAWARGGICMHMRMHNAQAPNRPLPVVFQKSPCRLQNNEAPKGRVFRITFDAPCRPMAKMRHQKGAVPVFTIHLRPHAHN